MLRMQISESNIQEVIKSFDLDQKEVDRALKSTLRKSLSWLKGKSIKELSSITGIQQKILRTRIKVNVKNIKNISGFVWYGLLPISMMKLNPKQKKFGVQAGKTFRYNAFIAPVKSGSDTQMVYKRRGKARLPVDKQTVEIIADFRGIIDKLTPEFEQRVITILQQEMRWQLHKRS